MSKEELDSNIKLSHQIHETNLKKYFDRNPEALKDEIAIDFPTSLSMFNLGIKSRKVQSSTLQSVKYLEGMKEEINSIMATNAVDKQKKKELSEATTTFFLHKNYINMRALYGKNDGLRQLPKVLNEAPEMKFEVGKSPINKVNFTANY